jgi:hypothetical protein
VVLYHKRAEALRKRLRAGKPAPAPPRMLGLPGGV